MRRRRLWAAAIAALTLHPAAGGQPVPVTLAAARSFYARFATAETPQSVRLAAAGAITVYVYRASLTKGKARVAFLHDADGSVAYDSGWIDAAPRATVRLPAEKITGYDVENRCL